MCVVSALMTVCLAILQISLMSIFVLRYPLKHSLTMLLDPTSTGYTTLPIVGSIMLTYIIKDGTSVHENHMFAMHNKLLVPFDVEDADEMDA